MFFFKSKAKLIRTHNIMIKGQIINMVDVTKFLVVHIACLSWRHHIQNIRNKIAKGLEIICKARKVLQQFTLLTLYNSFILPYLTYIILHYGPVTMIVPASGHQVRCIPWVQMGTFNKEISFLCGLKFFTLIIVCGEYLQSSLHLMWQIRWKPLLWKICQ